MSNVVKLPQKERSCNEYNEITEFFANERKRVRKERQTVNNWALTVGLAVCAGWIISTLAAWI